MVIEIDSIPAPQFWWSLYNAYEAMKRFRRKKNAGIFYRIMLEYPPLCSSEYFSYQDGPALFAMIP